MTREEAKWRLADHFRVHDDGRPTPKLDEAVAVMFKALEKPEQKWVPVSERLPENDGRYLCFWGTNVMEVFRFSNDLYAVDEYDFQEYKFKKQKGFYYYSSEYGYLEIDYVTAWMPLPEPYVIKGENDETNKF